MTDIAAHRRLSDYVFQALLIALEQEDLEIAQLLTRALEQSMTRFAGGPDFEERRQLTEEFQAALVKLEQLRNQKK